MGATSHRTPCSRPGATACRCIASRQAARSRTRRGRPRPPGMPYAAASYLRGRELGRALAGEVCTFDVVSQDARGNTQLFGGEPWRAELVGPYPNETPIEVPLTTAVMAPTAAQEHDGARRRVYARRDAAAVPTREAHRCVSAALRRASMLRASYRRGHRVARLLSAGSVLHSPSLLATHSATPSPAALWATASASGRCRRRARRT